MISYIRRGEGKDLVLLHGYLSSKESFYPQISYFSRFFRVTALDFPGFCDQVFRICILTRQLESDQV